MSSEHDPAPLTELRPTEAQPTEAQPTEAQPTEAQPTEAQPTEAQPTEAQPDTEAVTRATRASGLNTGGTVRPISRWGTPVLHTRTEPVTRFDDELHTLVRDMFATMAAAEGVGLAATQVGVSLSVFVYDCPDDDERRQLGVLCNPVVTLPEGRDRKLDAADEGCLSLPGGYVELARPDQAVAHGQDADGRPVAVVGTGLLARCLQHETDHLNGTVFGDRLSGRARKKLYAQHEDRAPKYPADWPVHARTDRDDDLDDLDQLASGPSA